MKTLLQKCQDLTKTMYDLSKYGAYDTEPRSYFKQLLRKKLVKHEDVKAISGQWDLYSSMSGSKAAEDRLTKKMNTILKISNKRTMTEIVEVINYYGLN